MKKGILILLLCVVVYQQYQRVDLSKYRSNTIQVEVKGQVANPGIKKVDYDTTVQDILKQVQLLDDADISGINLTKSLENGSVLVIPKIQTVSKVSINTGTISQLDSLPGIGPSTAQKIIDYRNSHPFQTLEQIMNVKGIKDRLFQKIKDLICL